MQSVVYVQKRRDRNVPRPKRPRPKRLRPNRPDRNGQTEMSCSDNEQPAKHLFERSVTLQEQHLLFPTAHTNRK